jgi:hypothetical protein
LLGHKPTLQNEVFGRPLFTAKPEEQAPYLRDSYLIAASYAAVYAALSDNGKSLYVADGVNSKDYYYDLTDKVTNHRLKAVAGVTDCKSCSGQRPAGWVPHQAGFKK